MHMQSAIKGCSDLGILTPLIYSLNKGVNTCMGRRLGGIFRIRVLQYSPALYTRLPDMEFLLITRS